MSIAYVLFGILGGGLAAMASYWVGYTTGQVALNYIVLGNLTALLALTITWPRATLKSLVPKP